MAERKGLLLCVCQGTCPSFDKMDFFEILNTLRREQAVDWVALHPQLCAEDGDEFLKDLLTGGGVDKLYVAGCDPTMQRKMFRDALEAAGISREAHSIRFMPSEASEGFFISWFLFEVISYS